MMKKFTNLEKIEELKEVNPKINKLVEKLVSLNLSVSYSGDSNDIIGKNVKINGVNKLVEDLETFIEKKNNETRQTITENLKYSIDKNNQTELLNKIELLKETKHDNIIWSPEDIFDVNDYTKTNKQFILETMNSIPLDFLHKVNKREVSDYFSNGNKITIIYEGLDKGWYVSFNNSNKYGTSTDDNMTKYNYFVKENSEFIADFIAATSELIGSKNLKLDNKLVK